MTGYAHPASVQARVGSVLGYIEMNIEQQDMAGLWNFVRLLQRYAAPFMKDGDGKKAATRLDGMDDPMTLDDDEAFDNMMERVEACLEVLHVHNIYGYGKDVGLGDGSDLMREPTGVPA